MPIHSVRLPGIVADQEVILGDVAPDADASATSRRTARASCPACCSPCGAVGVAASRRVVGLEHLLGLSASAPLVAVTDHAVERYRQRVRGAWVRSTFGARSWPGGADVGRGRG